MRVTRGAYTLAPPSRIPPRSRQMAYAGQILENPVTGEHITFRKTAADTGGEYCEIDLRLKPDGAVTDARNCDLRRDRGELDRRPGGACPGDGGRAVHVAQADRARS